MYLKYNIEQAQIIKAWSGVHNFLNFPRVHCLFEVYWQGHLLHLEVYNYLNHCHILKVGKALSGFFCKWLIVSS